MKLSNPFEGRDLTKTLLWPCLSWSSYNAFTSYDREKWYDQYVLGIRGPSNPAMDAGRVIGERLATDPAYLPMVPRPEIYEQELAAKLDKIRLVGHLDGWSPSVPEILEYKTTQNKIKWDKKTVATHGQLDFYCLLVWLNFKIPPEKLKLSLTAIHLKESGSFNLEPTGQVEVIPTTRTMKDILLFAGKLKKVHNQMSYYVKYQTPGANLCPYCGARMLARWEYCDKKECKEQAIHNRPSNKKKLAIGLEGSN